MNRLILNSSTLTISLAVIPNPFRHSSDDRRRRLVSPHTQSVQAERGRGREAPTACDCPSADVRDEEFDVAAVLTHPHLEHRAARQELADVAEREPPQPRPFVKVSFTEERQRLHATAARQHLVLIRGLVIVAVFRRVLSVAPHHIAPSLEPRVASPAARVDRLTCPAPEGLWEPSVWRLSQISIRKNSTTSSNAHWGTRRRFATGRGRRRCSTGAGFCSGLVVDGGRPSDTSPSSSSVTVAAISARSEAI